MKRAVIAVTGKEKSNSSLVNDKLKTFRLLNEKRPKGNLVKRTIKLKKKKKNQLTYFF